MQEEQPKMNKELLVKNLEELSQSSDKNISETAMNALQLLREYDDVLRSITFSLSAGGYNSDGLIDPQIAEDKIRWGIDDLVKSAKNTSKS